MCPALDSFFVEWDCPVEGGCSLHRPDMLWELPTFWFAIEVDEEGGEHEDDRERLCTIARSMGDHRPGVVLRINPDGGSADVTSGPFFYKAQAATDGTHRYNATRHFIPCMQRVSQWIHTNVLGPWIDDPLVAAPVVHSRSGSVNPTVYKLFF